MGSAFRIGALLLLLAGSALVGGGCRSMADSYGSDIPNDTKDWELTGAIGSFAP